MDPPRSSVDLALVVRRLVSLARLQVHEDDRLVAVDGVVVRGMTPQEVCPVRLLRLANEPLVVLQPPAAPEETQPVIVILGGVHVRQARNIDGCGLLGRHVSCR